MNKCNSSAWQNWKRRKVSNFFKFSVKFQNLCFFLLVNEFLALNEGSV